MTAPLFAQKLQEMAESGFLFMGVCGYTEEGDGEDVKGAEYADHKKKEKIEMNYLLKNPFHYFRIYNQRPEGIWRTCVATFHKNEDLLIVHQTGEIECFYQM